MFPRAKTIVRLFGLDIRIDPSWVLIATLITWSLWKHVFPYYLPGLPQATYAVMALSAMLLFFVSLVMHELAHALTARRFGVETQAITLFVFGGVAELQEDPRRARDEFWIALAGPALSIALAAMLAIYEAILRAYSAPVEFTVVVGYLALINLVLGVFNMLPAFPLDGGRVLRAWLWHRGGDVLAATETAARVGLVLAYGLIALGFLSLFNGGLVGGAWQILLGLFVQSAARSSVESQRVKTLLGHKTVFDLCTRSPVVTTPQMTLAELANLVLLRHRVSFVPVVEDNVLLGHINASVLGEIDQENWTNTQVNDVFIGLSNSPTVPGDMPVAELFMRIAQTGQRKFMVTDNGDLVGVVTLADLTRYLALLTDLGHKAPDWSENAA